MIVFVVPIRHPGMVKDAAHQQACLRDLFASLANQTSDVWKAVIVGNREQDLPPLPPQVTFQPVDFEPEVMDYDGVALQDMWRMIRLDKGRRIHAGFVHAAPGDQVMVVDDDDLIHRDLAGFVAANPSDTFWFVPRGYFWEDGTRRIGLMNRLHKHCGSSLVIPKSAFLAAAEPADSPSEAAISELGSHHLIFERFPETGSNWHPVPFRATIYRVRHSNASMTAASDERRRALFTSKAFRKVVGFLKGLRRGFRGDARVGIAPFPMPARVRRAFFGARA